MTVTEPGLYILEKEFAIKSSFAVNILPKNKVLHITRVDEDHHKVYTWDVGDWVHWDLPVRKQGG